MIGSTDTNVVAEGKDGTASAAGADGVDGKSAYELYLDTVE
jgi:autotransporter adhesin